MKDNVYVERRGRPPGKSEVISEAITMRVHPPLMKRLDNWRRDQPDLPTRQDAVRRLLDRALSK